MPTAKATVKAAVKKPAKTAPKKSAPKAAKKVFIDARWEAIENGFVELHKGFAEIRERQKDFQQGMDELRMSHKETEKVMRETQRAIKETQRNIGGLNNTMGSVVEHIMRPDLPRKFKPFGFTFDRVTTVKWADGKGNIYTEIDGLLENGEQAMVVEVKTTLRREDIDDHLGRMERVRAYADAHGDKRKFLGAMAAMVTDMQTKEYALSKGFFVIEPSGEDVKVTKPASAPRIW
jgi:hypothetical protein